MSDADIQFALQLQPLDHWCGDSVIRSWEYGRFSGRWEMVGCLPQAATGSQQRRLGSRGKCSFIAFTHPFEGDVALDWEKVLIYR